MRIIGGEWRGRKIEEPRGRDVTRPTTDRVREACASMVMSAFDFDLDEVRVLDAFGGSGALGIEMLSRGARSLTTFEIDRNAARLITKNIESLCRDRARWRVVMGDVLASASRGRVPDGPFDPITFGHIDVIRRARRIFPSVIVAVAESQGKNGVGTTFMLDERVALAREALGDIDGVEVLPFTGLLVDFAREQGAGAVVKGLRAMTDFEYELQQADLNYRLDNELESIFVMSAPQYGYISSSVVRQIASLGSDVSNFVPPNVVRALKYRFS